MWHLQRSTCHWGRLVCSGTIAASDLSRLAPTFRAAVWIDCSDFIRDRNCGQQRPHMTWGRGPVPGASSTCSYGDKGFGAVGCTTSISVGGFRKLSIPRWDREFVHRLLWKKLQVAARIKPMTRSHACPFDRHLEDHDHFCMSDTYCVFVHSAAEHAHGKVLDARGSLVLDVNSWSVKA